MTKSIIVVGGRGYVGQELLPLVHNHPDLEIKAVSSRMLTGEPIQKHVHKFTGDLKFAALSPQQMANLEADLALLALPNGESTRYVDALAQAANPMKLVDLSADHRLNPAWQYGLVEHRADALRHQNRIANPGCYATGMQIGIKPFCLFSTACPRALGFRGSAVRAPPRRTRTILRFCTKIFCPTSSPTTSTSKKPVITWGPQSG